MHLRRTRSRPALGQLREITFAMFDASGQRRIIGFGEARQREDDDSVFEVGQPGERCLTVSLGSGLVGPELGEISTWRHAAPPSS